MSAYAPSASPTARNANFVRSFDAARNPAVVDPIPRRFGARGTVGASTSGDGFGDVGCSPDSSPSGPFRSRPSSFASFFAALAITSIAGRRACSSSFGGTSPLTRACSAAGLSASRGSVSNRAWCGPPEITTPARSELDGSKVKGEDAPSRQGRKSAGTDRASRFLAGRALRSMSFFFPVDRPLYTLSGSAGRTRLPFTRSVSNAIRTCASVQLIA